jgi:hypothetical protein
VPNATESPQEDRRGSVRFDNVKIVSDTNESHFNEMLMTGSGKE